MISIRVVGNICDFRNTNCTRKCCYGLLKRKVHQIESGDKIECEVCIIVYEKPTSSLREHICKKNVSFDNFKVRQSIDKIRNNRRTN